MNKRQIGKAYEAQAAEFLEKYGFVGGEKLIWLEFMKAVWFL